MNSAAQTSRLRRIFHDWFPSVILVALLLMARSTLADHYHVPSGSMEHALIPGDHVVVNKAAYGLRVPFTKRVIAWSETPERGEVVIFDSPVDDTRLIKRVVAIAGDRVEVRDGHVILNGQPVSDAGRPDVEQLGHAEVHLNLAKGGGPNLSEFVVPENEVLVLGDYRGNSRDGRVFGTVPVSELYGRASGVFWRRSEGPTWKEL